MSNVNLRPQPLIFAGTPEFAAVALNELVRAGHRIPLVLTQPDRPSGRGMKLQPTPVKVLAQSLGLTVAQPPTLRDAETQEFLQKIVIEAGVEFMVVAAYGLILPQTVLDLPPNGCLNIHASLLPRWRGAAPIQRAIEAGDRETGVGIMKMEAGLDTGAVLLETIVPITGTATGATLNAQLATAGAALIVDVLARCDTLQPKVQPIDGVVYAHKLTKNEGFLDFTNSAEELARRVRAFDPFPGCSGVLDGAIGGLDSPTIKFWSAELFDAKGFPGEVLHADASGIVIACGTGALRVTELQKPGGRRINVRDFLAGFPLQRGQLFRLRTSKV